MVQVEHIVKVPYSDAMTEAGIAHLVQVLQANGDHPTYSGFDAMRQYVAEKAAMLAFRHLMDEERTPYQLTPKASFQNDLEPELTLGGRRATLFTTLVRDRRAIALLGREPERINGVPALVPRIDNMHLQNQDDVYVFTAVTGLVTRSREELQRAVDAGQPLRLLYPLPRSWRMPDSWADLGELIIKMDMRGSLAVGLGGVDGERNPVFSELVVMPGERHALPERFHALRYMRIQREPDGPLGLHSPALKETHIASMYEWGNLWVYGMDVYFLGYLTYGEYQRRAKFVPVGTSRFGIPSTTQSFWSVPVPVLRPLSDLFSRVNAWAAS
jgi:hypothetical protein